MYTVGAWRDMPLRTPEVRGGLRKFHVTWDRLFTVRHPHRPYQRPANYHPCALVFPSSCTAIEKCCLWYASTRTLGRQQPPPSYRFVSTSLNFTKPHITQPRNWEVPSPSALSPTPASSGRCTIGNTNHTQDESSSHHRDTTSQVSDN